MVFINYERLIDAPLLTSNPIILYQNSVLENPMDITPFVPILVEATKFILTRTSNYIDNHSADTKDVSLPITQAQLEEAEAHKDRFSKLVNASVSRADIFEIEQLLKQIEKHRKIVASLETEYTTRPNARIDVEINNEKGQIAEKAIELQQRLMRIYS